MNKLKVFISKNLNELTSFSCFCSSNNISLIAKSFIKFSITKNRLNRESDIYFFSSKKSFDFFLETHSIDLNKKISCIGSETKQYIENLGYKVDFYSKNAGSPDIASMEFKNWVKNRKISFFLSQISKKSISSKIPDEQKEEIILYNTEIISSKLKNKYDIYIFTSPSNVIGFFKKNTCIEDSIILAWGRTTELELLKYTQKINYTLKESTFDELIKYLSEILLLGIKPKH